MTVQGGTEKPAAHEPERPSIVGCRPAQSLFLPGEDISIWVRCAGSLSEGVRLRLTVMELDYVIAVVETQAHPGETVLRVSVPPHPGRGYGVDVDLVDVDTGALLDRRSTAVDVQESWVHAPRYGFLSEFPPDREYDETADQLLDRHVNAVQFYDWMYRHFRYLPPQDTFVDAIGRTLALSSTRQAIAQLHERRIAAIAYGSVYGAEPEYALHHRHELLYDEGGEPVSLGGAFYYQDVRPGSWRDLILDQYRDAVRCLNFDGVQADQYGPQAPMYDATGHLVDMPAALASMVRSAHEAVRDAGGAGVIFNCVNNWPIDAVAPEPQLCTYIELWPPHIHLHDLLDLILNAKRLAPDRAVVLAAYMSCAGEDVNAAEEATLLTSSVIHASGGSHLLLGEGSGILTDPYFPKFVRPGSRFQRRIVDHWSFIVRYVAYLVSSSLHGCEARRADGLWQIERRGPEFSTVSLLNADPDDVWDVVRPIPEPRTNVLVEAVCEGEVGVVLVASPEEPGPPRRVEYRATGGRLQFTVPSVRTWTLAIILPHEVGPGEERADVHPNRPG